MIILILLRPYSLPPRLKPIMFLRNFPRLSRMKRIMVFLPLNLIMGEKLRMRDLKDSIANLESSTTFHHQGLHNRME